MIFPPGRARLSIIPVATGSGSYRHDNRNRLGRLLGCTDTIDNVEDQDIDLEVARVRPRGLGRGPFPRCIDIKQDIFTLDITEFCAALAETRAYRTLGLNRRTQFLSWDFRWLLRLGGNESAKSIAQSARTVIFLFMSFPLSRSTRHSTLDTSSHLITFSARIITTGGIVKPSALAVLRLITSSNLVGCSTGRSAGLVPFRILSTNNGCTPVGFSPVGSVGHQATAVDKIFPRVYRRQPIFFARSAICF